MLTALLQLDRAVTEAVASALSATWLQWTLVGFTALGVGGSVWYLLAGVFWMLAPRLSAREGGVAGLAATAAGGANAAQDRRQRESARRLDAAPMDAGRPGVARMRAAVWRAVMGISLALLLADAIVKPIVGRDRPFVSGPPASPLFYQPTTRSFPSGHAASAGAGAFALARVWPPAAVPLAALAALIALSRVALGVHFVGDILAGLLLGVLAAAFASPRSAHAPPRAGTPS